LLTYEDPSSGIRTQYPFDWKLASYNTNQLKESGKIVEFWPISSTTDSVGVPDISVTIHTNETKSNISIDKIANNHVKTYRKQIPNFKLLEMDNSTSFSGLPAFKLIVKLGSDSTPIRGMIVGTVLDDTLYRFTYVSPPGKFDAYLSKVMNMMESFKIGLE
jgi:PsbP